MILLVMCVHLHDDSSYRSHAFSIFYLVDNDVALLQTMATRQLSFWLRLGCMMCTLSLIRGLGKCCSSCQNRYGILSSHWLFYNNYLCITSAPHYRLHFVFILCVYIQVSLIIKTFYNCYYLNGG